jgi:hypothetical protein
MAAGGLVGATFSVGAQTGAIGAALGADSTVFSMRLNPSSTQKAYILAVTLDWAVSTAFTTPVVAGRVLQGQRATTATPSGGTAIAAATKRNSSQRTSQFDSANSGDIRVATTGALTMTSVVFEDIPEIQFDVAGYGAATALKHQEWDFQGPMRTPITVKAGELFVIRNQAAMDAAGVWSLGVEVTWAEVSA